MYLKFNITFKIQYMWAHNYIVYIDRLIFIWQQQDMVLQIFQTAWVLFWWHKKTSYFLDPFLKEIAHLLLKERKRKFTSNCMLSFASNLQIKLGIRLP